MASVSDVDDPVLSAAARWRLTVGERLTGGTGSAVYAATDEFGRDLVLKLSKSGVGDTAAAEAAALAAWSGTGATVTLIAATDEALLLTRIRPGTLMPWQLDDPWSDSIEVAADLLRRLWATPPNSYRYPTSADVYPEDERVARGYADFERRRRGDPDRGVPGLVRLPAAAAAAEQLISTTAAPTLLHRDFITKNLLRDQTSPPAGSPLIRCR